MKHDYGFFACDDTRWNEFAGGRPPSWAKVRALLQILPDYDVVVWLDSDAMVVRSDRDMLADVPPNKTVAMVRHQTLDGEVPNAGILLLRNSSGVVDLLKQIWNRTEFIDHGWWEQAALMQLIGWRINRPCGKERTTEFTGMVHFLGNEWNCHMSSQQLNEARIHHWTCGSFQWRVRGLEDDYSEINKQSTRRT